MANKSRRSGTPKSKTKRPARKTLTYSAAEKKAFRAGMAKQYNTEHPKFSFAAATKETIYWEDGSKYLQPRYGLVSFFKTEAEAKEYVKRTNAENKIRNERVKKAVKAKKVDFAGGDCVVDVAEYKRIVPTRVNSSHYRYDDLPTPKKSRVKK